MDTPPEGAGADDPRRELLLEAARRTSGEGVESPPRSFLLFSLGGELFAADLLHVRRILRPDAVARVPGAPPEVLGLMNSQGEVLCVLDPRKILGLPDRGADGTEGAFVVVIHYGEKEAGLLVDSAEDVWEVAASDVSPVLDSLDPAKARFYEGTLSRGGRSAGILAPAACLNP